MGINQDLFGVTVEQDKPKEIPTLLQYLKSATKAKLGQTFQVEIIWLPNKFSNFTIQTHAFRIRVSDTNPFYSKLDEATKNLKGTKEAWGIKVDPDMSGNYHFEIMDKKKGYWDKLGANGLVYKDN